jgi:acylphosphatase
MMKRLKIRVYGRVQGVAFRHYARSMARQLGIKGFVKNMADGSVYIEAEAGEQDLGKFVRWCRQGPGSARVDDMETEELPVNNDSDFQVRY